MGIKLILLIAVAAVVAVLVNWFTRTPPQQVRKVLGKTLLWGVIGIFVVLALTGRLPWLFALAAAAVPLLQRGLSLLRLVPLIQQLMASLGLAKASRGPTGGQQSTVTTAWLRMTLDHDSGAMDGEVLQGQFKDRRLSQLSLEQLLELFDECRRRDPESAPLLETYLDREHGQDWRRQSGADPQSPPPASDGNMDRAEALAILGLEEGATIDDIRAAHKRLMQRLHPDRGGSTWLATRINAAKRLLLA